MKKIPLLARIVPFAFVGLAWVGLASMAEAQIGGGDVLNRASGCNQTGAASRRRRSACDDPAAQTTVTAETEATVTTQLPARAHTVCGASAAVGYFQSNALAKAETKITIEGCPAAATGTYTVAARVRDANGEEKVLEFPETFQRDDDQPLELEKEYPIGENVELMSLRARTVRCTCVEEADAEQAEAAEPAAADPGNRSTAR